MHVCVRVIIKCIYIYAGGMEGWGKQGKEWSFTLNLRVEDHKHGNLIPLERETIHCIM